ncbi:MAG: hypothetical protein SNH35_02365 [Rikenellaceae bacterium]
MKNVILYILAAVALVGCFKDEEYNTKLVLRPMEQVESDGDFVAYADCVAYVFDADSTEWMVASWADAVSGVLTSKEDGVSTKSAYATASGYSEEGLEDTMLSVNVALMTPMIVVANTVTENYGYTQYSVGLNLATTYLYARFRPWKECIYTEGSWVYSAPEVEDEVVEDEE